MRGNRKLLGVCLLWAASLICPAAPVPEQPGPVIRELVGGQVAVTDISSDGYRCLGDTGIENPEQGLLLVQRLRGDRQLDGVSLFWYLSVSGQFTLYAGPGTSKQVRDHIYEVSEQIRNLRPSKE